MNVECGNWNAKWPKVASRPLFRLPHSAFRIPNHA
jgi:hypothetical protein